MTDRTWTPPQTHEITLADERVLQYSVYGPEDGTRVVMHGGTPSTRWLSGKLQAQLEQCGIRALAYDRPGYGGSTRQPGRAVVDVVDDVARLADAVGWDRFAAWGGSGGGSHVLATAARLPDRVSRCAAVVSGAPIDGDGLDWWEGMSPVNVEEYTLAQQGEDVYRPLVERLGREVAARVEAGDVWIPPEFEMAEADLELARRRLAEPNPGRAEVGRQLWLGGVDGWIDDGIALSKPWGFDVAEITVPVSIWYGPADVLSPIGHSEWLLTHVPHAERCELSGGHTLTDDDLTAVYTWLAG